MLLALYPLLFSRNNTASSGRLVDPDITHRAIRGKEIIPRTPAMIAADAHLLRLQEAAHGADAEGNRSAVHGMGGVPGSDQPVGNVAVRIPRYERAFPGRLPVALGTSPSASDVVSFAADQTMRILAAQHALDEDEEEALALLFILNNF